jgi:hypothetical protein
VLGDQIKKIDIKDKHICEEEFLGLMEAVRVQMGQAKEMNRRLREEVEEERAKMNEYRDRQDRNKDIL